MRRENLDPRNNIVRTFIGCLAFVLLTGACASSKDELEKVAKDWSLTIRASQVIPVYPLTEDFQPGDVYIVQTPISQQAKIYSEKGFLPTDQLVTRLHGLDYASFYKDAFFKGNFGTPPHGRPGIDLKPEDLVMVPRAAFPSYNFSIDSSGGAKLAIPIQGVPVGLGLMRSTQASGTVTISDAYTYGIDSEHLVRKLLTWYHSDEDIRKTLESIAEGTEADVYLRVVSRVFLAYRMEILLINKEAKSGGVDAGAPQEVKPPNLSDDKDTAMVRLDNLKNLSEALNAMTDNLPGGSFRFTEVNSRTVSMSETFDRPLVIGFHGFDVKVLKSGQLSAPIPSFAVLEGEIEPQAFSSTPAAISFCTPTDQMKAYRAWLKQDQANFTAMQKWLEEQGIDRSPIDLATNCGLSLLTSANSKFGFY
ncbi:MAG: hypothetical protein AAF530_10830 [Pseudomonadota bacterium]